MIFFARLIQAFCSAFANPAKRTFQPQILIVTLKKEILLKKMEFFFILHLFNKKNGVCYRGSDNINLNLEEQKHDI